MKKTDKKYVVMALCMCVFLVGTLLLIEQQAGVSLFAASLFCLLCSGMLLFCLMKLNVMEFQEGSFWYRLNQAVNQSTAPQKRHRTVTQRSTRYALQSAAGQQTVCRKVA